MPIEPTSIMVGAKALIASVKDLLTVKSGYDKQHIDLLKTKVQMLVDLAESYQNENKELAEKIASLREQLSKYQKSENYVENSGAAFKRNADGSYDETPYCPRCHNSMSSDTLTPYLCSNKTCGHIANFNGRQLQSVIKKLPK